jgi:hydroxysqualene synthase
MRDGDMARHAGAATLGEAYAACARVAREHYENFPVASRLLPAPMRPHVAAVYAFARAADDFADEDGYTTERRFALLDDWQARLRAAAGLGPAPATPAPAAHTAAADASLVFAALGHTMRTCDLPVALFEDLLSAFRQDVTVRRYRTWDDLLDYCRRSANPVGRLVLRIGGYRSGALDDASDALCTALQLTNFWQDLAIDWRRGRLYVPESEREAAGASEADLAAGRVSPAWRVALGSCSAVTRDLFDKGRPVCDGVRGRLRWELRGTWLGATRVLDRLEHRGFDVFAQRPSLSWRDAPWLGWQLLAWHRRAPRAGARAGLPTIVPTPRR